MKININASIAVALSFTLLAPLRASDPTPWDSMNKAFGVVTVEMKTGKTLKKTDNVTFTRSAVLFLSTGFSIPRQEIKEVVIRQQRQVCCDALVAGVLPLALVFGGMGDAPSPESIPLIIVWAPLAIGMAAVTGPPLLIIEGIRRLKPTKLLYRVIP